MPQKENVLKVSDLKKGLCGIAALYIGYPALPDEETALLKLCDSRSYVVAGVYRENDKKEAYGILKRMLREAENSVFDILIAYSPQRLGCTEGGAIAEGLFKNRNVRTVYLNADPSAEQALLRGYFARYANLYSDYRSPSEYATGDIVAGYVKCSGKIVIRKSEANAIKEIFERVLNGVSVSEELLVRAGRRPLAALLRDRRYTGAVSVNGARKYFVLPQIVDEETFEAVREMLAPVPESYPLADVLPEGSGAAEENGKAFYVVGENLIEKDFAERAVFNAARELLAAVDGDKLAFSAFNAHLKLYSSNIKKRLELRQADIDYSASDEADAADKLKTRNRLEADFKRAALQRTLPLNPMHFKAYFESLTENGFSVKALTEIISMFIEKVEFSADRRVVLTPIRGLRRGDFLRESDKPDEAAGVDKRGVKL